jgi:putative transposase
MITDRRNCSRQRDNSQELTSQTFTDWCKAQDIAIRFIQPGKPDQNAYIERFKRTYREEVLSAYLFDSLNEVREITGDWLERYNEIRPHDALGSLPPARYRERLLAAETPV